MPRSAILFALILIMAARIVAYFIPDLDRGFGIDFYPRYAGGQLLLEGKNPYDFVAVNTLKTEYMVHHYSTGVPTNPPFWVWVNQIFPLLGVPPRVAAVIWFLISIITILVSCILLC